MIIDKYLYIRNGEEINSTDSICIPVRNIKGMVTNTVGAIRIFYKSAYNTSGDGTSEDVISDYASFNITTGKSLSVFKEIVSAIKGNKLSQDGRIIIADDNEAVYIHPDITSVNNNHLVTSTAFS